MIRFLICIILTECVHGTAFGQIVGETTRGYIIIVDVNTEFYSGAGLLYVDSKDISVNSFEKKLFPVDTTISALTYYSCCIEGDMDNSLKKFFLLDSLEINRYENVVWQLNMSFLKDKSGFSFDYEVKKRNFYHVSIWPIIVQYCKCNSEYTSFREMSFQSSEIVLFRNIELDHIKSDSEYLILKKSIKKILRKGILR